MIHLCSVFLPNACHNGLGEVAAFLRLFAKTVTVYPSPIDGTGYTIFG
jgi:hypothetical protein